MRASIQHTDLVRKEQDTTPITVHTKPSTVVIREYNNVAGVGLPLVHFVFREETGIGPD
jgi:hypothetical protein